MFLFFSVILDSIKYSMSFVDSFETEIEKESYSPEKSLSRLCVTLQAFNSALGAPASAPALASFKCHGQRDTAYFTMYMSLKPFDTISN